MLKKNLLLSGVVSLFILQIIVIPDVLAVDAIDSISVGTSPIQIAVNPTTNTIYVTNHENTVLVIDDNNNDILETIDTGTFPRGIAVNPTTNTIYVTNPLEDSISVIDGSNNTVVDTIKVKPLPRGIAVNPTTNTLYVTNPSENSVSVIDERTYSITDTINTGTLPRGIAVNPTTNTIYVTNPLEDSISVIDGSNNTVVDTIVVPDGSFGIAVNPQTNTIYSVSCFYEASTISVINGFSNILENSIVLEECAWTVAINSHANTILVAKSNGDIISFIGEGPGQSEIGIPLKSVASQKSERLEIPKEIESVKKIEGSGAPVVLQITEKSSQISQEVLTYFGIIVTVVIVGVISIKLLVSRKYSRITVSSENEKESEKMIRKEKKSITQKIHDRFGNSQPEIVKGIDPELIIENKLHLILKLEEYKIGDKTRLETIKESLITEGVFTKNDNDYIETIYEQYKKIALIND